MYTYAYITSLGSGLGGGALMAHLVSPQPKILYETLLLHVGIGVHVSMTVHVQYM